MIRIYGVSDELIIVEENGVELEKIDCNHNDIQFEMSDGTIVLFQYSIKKSKVWTASIVDEGYGDYVIEEYDEEASETRSDAVEVDAEYYEYNFV